MSQPRATRILLVEDNEVNQRLFVKMLAIDGHQVAVAGNGVEALEFLASNQVDLILMDCQMPVMDGFEAIQKIRQQQQQGYVKQTPILVLTAHVMPGDREKCLEAGADEFLAKPIRLNELSQAVQQWAL